jgi:uncharacterized protein YegJ (DUF2314 family)
MKLLLILAVVGALLAWWLRRRITVDDQGMSHVRGDDRDMKKAFAQAQESLPAFLSRLAAPGSADEAFGVKVAITNDEGMVENLWVSDVSVDGEDIAGIIGNDPVYVPYKLGDAWRGKLADVRDWTWMADGRMQGNFTLRAMLPRMPRAQREQFGRMLEARWDKRDLVHTPAPPDAAMPGQPLGFELSNGDPVLMEGVQAHLEQHLGKLPAVFHELVSPSAHIDLYPFPANTGRNFHVVATTGMAERPMQLPPGSSQAPSVELLVCLPPNWSLAHKDWSRDDASFTPMRWLKRVARHHYETGRWLGEGHLLANGDPAVAIDEGGAYDSVVLTKPRGLGDIDRVLLSDGREVRLLCLTFLRADERERLQREGWEAFESSLAPDRLSV